MSVLVGKKAPLFSAPALINGNDISQDYSLEQFIGKNEVVFFSFTQKILHSFALQNYTLFKIKWESLKKEE